MHVVTERGLLGPVTACWAWRSVVPFIIGLDDASTRAAVSYSDCYGLLFMQLPLEPSTKGHLFLIIFSTRHVIIIHFGSERLYYNS